MKFFIPIVCIFILSNYSDAQVTFTDVAQQLGVADPGNGQGTVFFDSNNDGYLDIYLVNNGSSNRLYLNTNGTTFTDVASIMGVANTGAGRGCAVADFNSDGLLDIVVGNFNQSIILYKNNLNSFSRFTDTAGMNLLSYGGSINWFDFNNDGKIDCYVGNDGIPKRVNYLFKNNNLLNFSQIADSAGFTDITSTLCTACADFDNDGDVD
ncbi:MAG: VCBS repeat-containing protein, partial [Ignavibacteria bacterium]